MGDEDFTAYVSSRWPTLVRSAVLLGCTPTDAEDLVQTVLARCYTSWSKVSAANNRDAYVYRMLVNAHTDSRRRHWWRERPTPPTDDRPDNRDATAAVDITDAVDRALGELSPAARAVVVLRFHAHLSEQQAATALGIPAGTVKSRLSRALAQLSASDHLTDQTDGTNR